MKKYLLFVFLLFPYCVFAQFAIVSTLPANNAVNVPLTTTVSITFSEAIDTLWMQSNGENTQFSNFDSVTSYGYSGDQKIAYANVVLKPNKPYFIGFTYLKAKSGATITKPLVYYFTTGASFPTTTVSGTILPGATGVSGQDAIVLLMTSPIDQVKDGPPPFAAWGNTNSNGTFIIPYVPSGKYWPLAVKDVDHDGFINPDQGVDVIALGDSFFVNSASITNLNLTFITFKPQILSETFTEADSLAKKLPADRVLRQISGWSIDTLGRTEKWEYVYSVNGNTMGQGIVIRSSGSEIYTIDPNYFNWVKMMKPLINYKSAASSATVIANVENAGGKAIRLATPPSSTTFETQALLVDGKNGWFGQQGYDTSKFYWMVSYVYNKQISENQSQWMGGKLFLCDFTTGAIVMTQPVITAVKNTESIPKEFSLSQNYPNPFNPSTTINYQLPVNGIVSLKVFDMLGREITTLVNEQKEVGSYTATFNGATLPSGMYFYQLRSGSFVETKKMLLMK